MLCNAAEMTCSLDVLIGRIANMCLIPDAIVFHVQGSQKVPAAPWNPASPSITKLMNCLAESVGS